MNTDQLLYYTVYILYPATHCDLCLVDGKLPPRASKVLLTCVGVIFSQGCLFFKPFQSVWSGPRLKHNVIVSVNSPHQPLHWYVYFSVYHSDESVKLMITRILSCSSKSHTHSFGSLHVCHSVDKCIFKVPAIAQAASMLSAGKSHSHTYIWLAFNQPERKLVGVVAATVQAVSLQQKSVSQLSPIVKANRSYLSSSFRLGSQPSCVDLTLAPRVYWTTHRAHWQHCSLWHRFVASSLLCGSEWQPKSWGQATSAEPPEVWTDGRTDNQCNLSIMMYQLALIRKLCRLSAAL